MKLITNKLLWSWVFILWAVALVIMNIIPSYIPPALQTDENSSFQTDYILHFISFLILAIVYFLSAEKNILRRISLNIILIFFLGLIFAALVEFIQTFVPGRVFNPVDMFCNIFGLLAGIPLAKLLNKAVVRIENKKKPL